MSQTEKIEIYTTKGVSAGQDTAKKEWIKESQLIT